MYTSLHQQLEGTGWAKTDVHAALIMHQFPDSEDRISVFFCAAATQSNFSDVVSLLPSKQMNFARLQAVPGTHLPLRLREPG